MSFAPQPCNSAASRYASLTKGVTSVTPMTSGRHSAAILTTSAASSLWLTALASDRYPNAVRLMAQIATVPVYPALREEEVDYAAALFGRVLADAGPLSMDPEK